MPKSSFQMHSSLPCRRGLSILAEIGGLSQEESDQFIGQIFNVPRARGLWLAKIRSERETRPTFESGSVVKKIPSERCVSVTTGCLDDRAEWTVSSWRAHVCPAVHRQCRGQGIERLY
jgi:hypothetical protein